VLQTPHERLARRYDAAAPAWSGKMRLLGYCDACLGMVSRWPEERGRAGFDPVDRYSFPAGPPSRTSRGFLAVRRQAGGDEKGRPKTPLKSSRCAPGQFWA